MSPVYQSPPVGGFACGRGASVAGGCRDFRARGSGRVAFGDAEVGPVVTVSRRHRAAGGTGIAHCRRLIPIAKTRARCGTRAALFVPNTRFVLTALRAAVQTPTVGPDEQNESGRREPYPGDIDFPYMPNTSVSALTEVSETLSTPARQFAPLFETTPAPRTGPAPFHTRSYAIAH